MFKPFLKISFVLGALTVILGAFGAHALKDKLESGLLNAYETGVRYQFYHVFALIAVGMLYTNFSSKCMKWAGYLFITGIILFSGSLYLICFINYQGITGLKWVGAITPLGGAAFIAGWVCGFCGVIKNPRSGDEV